MVCAAALSYISHGYAPRLEMIFAWWLTWIVLWVWWARSRAGLVGPVVSIVVFAAILVGPSEWQIGFEIERDCLDRHVAEALEPFEPGRTITDGRCGFMTWPRSDVAEVQVVGEADRLFPAVILWNAGTATLDPFRGNSLVYSRAASRPAARISSIRDPTIVT